jgi:hypothetical protein
MGLATASHSGRSAHQRNDGVRSCEKPSGHNSRMASRKAVMCHRNRVMIDPFTAKPPPAARQLGDVHGWAPSTFTSTSPCTTVVSAGDHEAFVGVTCRCPARPPAR